MSASNKKNLNSGFSLLELLIAMAITMTLMTAAATLLAGSVRMRSRENQKSDALADTQRALNIMSREIANSGFNLTNNGIVPADSGLNSIRVRANLNKFDFSPCVTDESRNNVQDEEKTSPTSLMKRTTRSIWLDTIGLETEVRCWRTASTA